jgi:sterol desaturase/sphingolipid hydroxylase (fatty acid hydroxylase superfamily)
MEGLIEYEKLRIERRGLWIIPAAGLFFAYVLGLSEIFKPGVAFALNLFDHPVAGMICIVTAHHLAFVTHCLVLYFLGEVKIKWFERFRVAKEWPFHLFNSAMKTMAVNFCLIIPAVEYSFIKTGILYPRFDENWPETKEIFQHLFFCIVAEDIWSYFGHRLMHSSYLYGKVHKQHHEYKSSISYSAEYAHPIEFFTVNILATGVGPCLLNRQMHFLTFLVWIVYRIGDTVDQHGGYDFPWSPFTFLPFASKI